MLKSNDPEQIVCSSCTTIQSSSNRFCISCGKKLDAVVTDKNSLAGKKIGRIGGFVIATLVYMIILRYTSGVGFSLILSTIGYSILILAFSLSESRNLFALFHPGRIKAFPLLLVMGLTTISPFLVTYLFRLFVTTNIEPGLNFTENQSEVSFFTAFIGIAVLTPVSEELAFRGLIFNWIEEIGGKTSAIFGTSFLFAIIHLSLLSIWWLLPFGILLGWLRARYNTLFYGLLGHFMHNGIVVMLYV